MLDCPLHTTTSPNSTPSRTWNTAPVLASVSDTVYGMPLDDGVAGKLHCHRPLPSALTCCTEWDWEADADAPTVAGASVTVIAELGAAYPNTRACKGARWSTIFDPNT